MENLSDHAAAKLSDHELFLALKAENDDAWHYIFHAVVEKELSSLRSGEMARRFGVDEGDVMGELYREMIAEGKIALYRDEGGSIVGWLRKYVHGYITRANPANREQLLTPKVDDEGNEQEFELPADDKDILRREAWIMTMRCFKDLWNDDPRKAYVLHLKTRMHLSSEEIALMLGISNAAAVDQIFSRAVKDMRGNWVKHEPGDAQQ